MMNGRPGHPTVQEEIKQYSDWLTIGLHSSDKSIFGHSGYYIGPAYQWVDRGINADWQTEFDVDLGESMVLVGEGHDPYNHIGEKVMAECIGVAG